MIGKGQHAQRTQTGGTTGVEHFVEDRDPGVLPAHRGQTAGSTRCIPFGEAAVFLEITGQLIDKVTHGHAPLPTCCQRLGCVPDPAAAQELLITALHISGKEGRLTAAVGEAQELPCPFPAHDFLFRRPCKQSACRLGRFCHLGDLFRRKLLEKLGSQYSRRSFAPQIKAPERPKPTGRTLGRAALRMIDQPQLDISLFGMIAGRFIFQIRFRRKRAADRADHVIVGTVVFLVFSFVILEQLSVRCGTDEVILSVVLLPLAGELLEAAASLVGFSHDGKPAAVTADSGFEDLLRRLPGMLDGILSLQEKLFRRIERDIRTLHRANKEVIARFDQRGAVLFRPGTDADKRNDLLPGHPRSRAKKGLVQLRHGNGGFCLSAKNGKQAQMKKQLVQFFLRRSLRRKIQIRLSQDRSHRVRRFHEADKQFRVDRPVFDHLRLFFCRTDDPVGRERDTCQLFGEADDLAVSIWAAERGTGQNVLHGIRLADPGAKTAHQQTRLHPGSAFVDVRFVQNDILQLSSGKDPVILWTKHHVFQHGIVRDQDVRRLLLHLLAGDQFIGKRVDRRAVGVLMCFVVLVERLALLMRRVAVIYAEADRRIVFQQGAQALDLVVGQRVHRVNDDGSDAGIQFAAFRFAQDVVENRDQKAFGFTGACARRHDQTLPLGSFLQRLLLVQIQRPVQF